MSLKDFLTALLVVSIWGVNFYITKTALDSFPPLLLGALRFGLVAFPALLFIPKPKTAWFNVVAYGVCISFGQFALLFSAIHMGMPTGLASLVLQSQVFFSVLLGVLIFKDRPNIFNTMGVITAGIGLIFLASFNQSGASFSLSAFILTLLGGLSWAGGNMMIKYIGPSVNPMSLVVWGNIAPAFLFFICTYYVESPNWEIFKAAQVSSYLSLFYLSFVASLVGYMLWGKLVGKYPVGIVAPLSLIVPVLGLSIGNFALNEHLTFYQWLSVLVILTGLIINILGQRIILYLRSLNYPQ